jgi:hypothetical protein
MKGKDLFFCEILYIAAVAAFFFDRLKISYEKITVPGGRWPGRLFYFSQNAGGK